MRLLSLRASPSGSISRFASAALKALAAPINSDRSTVARSESTPRAQCRCSLSAGQAEPKRLHLRCESTDPRVRCTPLYSGGQACERRGQLAWLEPQGNSGRTPTRREVREAGTEASQRVQLPRTYWARRSTATGTNWLMRSTSARLEGCMPSPRLPEHSPSHNTLAATACCHRCAW